MLRIRCDAKVSQCPLGEKYGCNPDTEAPQLIELAKSLNLDVNIQSNLLSSLENYLKIYLFLNIDDRY